MKEPLDLDAARKLVRQIITAKGNIAFRQNFSIHAKEQADKRKITAGEAYNVLKSGAVVGLDLIDGTWRYKVEASNIRVVVAFRSEDVPATELVVVTAIRIG